MKTKQYFKPKIVSKAKQNNKLFLYSKKLRVCRRCINYNGTDGCKNNHKKEFNEIGKCKYYINVHSAKKSNDTNTLVNGFAEYKTRLESKLNPEKQMQEKSEGVFQSIRSLGKDERTDNKDCALRT
jgi:hypothetical protein